MSTEPTRTDADRRLKYLKAGAVGVTVVGLGVFAGLAVAGDDEAHDRGGREQAGQEQGWHHDGDRDEHFFDDDAYGGSVGGDVAPSQGYDGSNGYGGDYGDAGGGGSTGGSAGVPSQGSSGAS